jgi:hypothetical protein
MELVAEVAQIPADDDALGRIGQAIETGRRRTGQNGLADSIDELPLQAFRIEREQQHAGAGPRIRRDLFGQL